MPWDATLTYAVLVTLALTATLPRKVKGGSWLQESSTWAGVFYGKLCVDAPVLDAQCGWRLVLTSDLALDSVTVYTALVTKKEGGKRFDIENQNYNGAYPSPGSAFCLSGQVAGSFGNNMPDYVSIDWDCICVTSTCESVTTTTTTSTTTTITTTMTSSTAAFSLVTTAGIITEARFTKHPGKWYSTVTSVNLVTLRLMCFRNCLLLPECSGVNVETRTTRSFVCSYVTEPFDGVRLTEASNLPNSFWQRH